MFRKQRKFKKTFGEFYKCHILRHLFCIIIQNLETDNFQEDL